MEFPTGTETSMHIQNLDRSKEPSELTEPGTDAAPLAAVRTTARP
jgi:hypothetical protein